MNILIVEDEFLIALDLQMQLEQLQHQVVGPAKDFATCRDLVEQHRPDLAFMDLRLAHGDSGETVAHWLLSEHNIRCVFMSANLDEVTQDRLRSLNPIAMLGKPTLPHLVADALDAFSDEDTTLP
ncbi:response regulator [Sulfitobacter sp. PS-8MA]|uniref:response regulator n=1 Tax=Sulfitobacter sp. PS-8MA TaxID=3237707 RepID=UPI0034C5BDD2